MRNLKLTTRIRKNHSSVRGVVVRPTAFQRLERSSRLTIRRPSVAGVRAGRAVKSESTPVEEPRQASFVKHLPVGNGVKGTAGTNLRIWSTHLLKGRVEKGKAMHGLRNGSVVQQCLVFRMQGGSLGHKHPDHLLAQFLLQGSELAVLVR